MMKDVLDDIVVLLCSSGGDTASRIAKEFLARTTGDNHSRVLMEHARWRNASAIAALSAGNNLTIDGKLLQPTGALQGTNLVGHGLRSQVEVVVQSEARELRQQPQLTGNQSREPIATQAQVFQGAVSIVESHHHTAKLAGNAARQVVGHQIELGQPRDQKSHFCGNAPGEGIVLED